MMFLRKVKDFPDPLTPVITTNYLFGISKDSDCKLWSLASRTNGIHM